MRLLNSSNSNWLLMAAASASSSTTKWPSSASTASRRSRVRTYLNSNREKWSFVSLLLTAASAHVGAHRAPGPARQRLQRREHGRERQRRAVLGPGTAVAVDEAR